MGNKIITEKDFWICSGGAVPAQLQTTQLSVKKVSGGYKYMTVADKSTSSWIDFGCRKLMLIMAILAAIVVVAVVATGGAALGVLIAAGAVAGAAGAAYGAVLGSLICGQKAAIAREWLGFKADFVVQGQNAITGDRQMLCSLFGETITFAPQIKNWWQAVALGTANYIGGIMEGMMAGAAVGFTGGVISGGPAVLGQLSLSNVGANWLATWGGVGLGLRGLITAQSTLGAYGNTGEVTAKDVIVDGVFGMETGTVHSAKNIATGNGTWQDVVGIGLWFLPVHDGVKQEPKTKGKETKSKETKSEEAKSEETKNKEENLQTKTAETEAPKQQGEFEAFEEGASKKNNSEFGDTLGEFSGREYFKDKCGGPIEKLSWQDATITKEGIEAVKKHTNRFGEDPANLKMLERLEAIARGEIEATPFDKRFYTHELREAERYNSMGIPEGEAGTYEQWNDAHTATLEDYQINEKQQPLYHPDADAVKE